MKAETSEVGLVEVRERHEISRGDQQPGRGEYCVECDQDWPCDAIRLADEVELKEEELKGLRKRTWTDAEERTRLRDEVELGNSAISKQIEVNSGLRDELASTTIQLNIFKRDLRKAEDRVGRLRADHQRVTDLVNAQAEDAGLWFGAQTAPEAYLQQELRRLHTTCETRAALADDGKGGG